MEKAILRLTGRVRFAVMLRCALATVTCALLTGCFETKQDITLNPDGSGKIVIESISAGVLAADKGITNFARDVIQDAKGVDAWREVSFRQLEDGRYFFRGTAYFSDLAKVKIGSSSGLNFSVTKDSTGNLTITAFSDKSESPIRIPETNEPVTAESIARQRAQFRALKPMMDSTIGSMKQETVFHLPGVVMRSSNFEHTTPQSLRIQLDGSKFVKAMEEALFSSGTNQGPTRLEKGESLEYAMNKILFGQGSPIQAVIKPGPSPLFDYAKEVTEAQQAFSAIVKLLKMSDDALVIAKPAVDGTPAKIKVTGIKWKFEKDSPNESLFRENTMDYVVSLKAELPGAVLKILRVQVLRATTIEGAELKTQEEQWIDEPRLWPGSTNVSFNIRFNPPPLISKGIAELSGFLECSSQENTRTVDLVVGKIRGGIKGAEFDTEIDDVQPNWAGGDKLILRMTLAPERLRSLKVVGEAGQTTKLECRNEMVIGNVHVFTFSSSHGIPRLGKLVAEVVTGNQTLRIPFAMTNVSLLGQPLH